MFGLPPRLPIDNRTQQWIDSGFQRMSSLLGKDRMLKADVILPTDKYFPDKYEKSGAGLEVLFRRVCTFMKVDRTKVELALIPDRGSELKKNMPYWEDQSSGPAGLYDGASDRELPVVLVKETFAGDPTGAVAVMAHELAHVILLGGNLIDREGKDMEPLTDLATVFLGLGIFTANVAFRYEKHQDNRVEGWSVSKTGYLSEEMFGYALAKFALDRKETDPVWRKHLASNIRSHFRNSLKWLEKNQKPNR